MGTETSLEQGRSVDSAKTWGDLCLLLLFLNPSFDLTSLSSAGEAPRASCSPGATQVGAKHNERTVVVPRCSGGRAPHPHLSPATTAHSSRHAAHMGPGPYAPGTWGRMSPTSATLPVRQVDMVLTSRINRSTKTLHEPDLLSTRPPLCPRAQALSSTCGASWHTSPQACSMGSKEKLLFGEAGQQEGCSRTDKPALQQGQQQHFNLFDKTHFLSKRWMRQLASYSQQVTATPWSKLDLLLVSGIV